MQYEIVSSDDDGYTKVVEILVAIEGAKGATKESLTVRFTGAERYKVGSPGIMILKTGVDFKAEIDVLVNEIYYPKEESPCGGGGG